MATADVGLEVKLRHRQITPLILEDDLRLPEEPDPQERELQSLRRQVSQQRAPTLSLLIGGDASQYPIARPVEILTATAPSLADMRRTHHTLVDERSAPPSGDDTFSQFARAAAAMQSTWLSPERIQQYNRELEEFFSKYAIFFNQLFLWEQTASLTMEVKLSLKNEGTAPASDVDVILQFPNDLALLTTDDLPERPQQPKLPRRPEPSEILFGTRDFDPISILRLGNQPAFPQYPRSINDSSDVNAELHEAQFWVRNLKHGFNKEFEPVFFRFPSFQAVRSFAVPYRILAAELPQPTLGELHFVVS